MSDIPLNAYISYNVSALKTWSRHSSEVGGGGGIIILVQPELSQDEAETVAGIISSRNLKHSDVHRWRRGGFSPSGPRWP